MACGHSGCFNSDLRAMFENAKAGDKVQGGSTLTQQLVKNMVLTPDQNYKRKFQEAYLSYEMEQILSKKEILELYLNRIYLGNSAYGIEAASQRYFGKSAVDVSVAEAALLAALPKAPSRYDPSVNPDAAYARARLVLQNMASLGMIGIEQMSEAEVNPAQIIEDSTIDIDEKIMGYAFDMIAEQAKGFVGGQAEDLIITSTIDPKLQAQAHKSVTDVSSFKPFVYAAALENGFTPGTVRIDQPINIAGWQPENYTKTYRGPINIREALKLSINTVAAQVGAEIGPTKVVELANRFGINSKLGAHYAIALGASESNLLDMTASYMVFANEGLKRSPYSILKITDTSGNVLYTQSSRQPERVYAAPYARQMTSMLRDVVDTGTGHGAKLGKRQVAGKTGTSQDFRDAWFVGFSRDYTTGVWLGNDDNSPMVKVTGGLLPVDAWVTYMRAASKGKKNRPLRAPDPTVDDPETQALMAFYESLTEALITERDLANGAPSVGSPPP